MINIPMPKSSRSLWTISIPTVPHPSTKPLSRMKPDVWHSDLIFTTRPNTAVGSIWPKQSLASFHDSAWLAESQINPHLKKKQRLWSRIATQSFQLLFVTYRQKMHPHIEYT